MYHDDDVEGVSFHPTKRWIASSSRDHTVRVFDFDWECIKVFRGHEADVISVEWSGDSDELLSSSDDGTIKRWHIDRQTFVKNIDLGSIETDTIAIADDGKVFARNDDGNIIILDTTGKIISEVNAHKGGIKKIAYDKAQNKLIFLSYDRSFKLWDITSDHHLVEIDKCDFPNVVWPRSCSFLDEHAVVFGTFGSSYAKYDLSTNEWDLSHICTTPGVNSVLATDSGRYTIGDAGHLKKNSEMVSSIPSLCNFLLEVDEMIFTGGLDGGLYNALTTELIYQFVTPLNCATTIEVHGKAY